MLEAFFGHAVLQYVYYFTIFGKRSIFGEKLHENSSKCCNNKKGKLQYSDEQVKLL